MKIITFSTDFRKNTQISNFVKTQQLGAESFNEDGRADGQAVRHDETTSRFSQFYKCV